MGNYFIYIIALLFTVSMIISNIKIISDEVKTAIKQSTAPLTDEKKRSPKDAPENEVIITHAPIHNL